jgi:hypothetical protein
VFEVMSQYRAVQEASEEKIWRRAVSSWDPTPFLPSGLRAFLNIATRHVRNRWERIFPISTWDPIELRIQNWFDNPINSSGNST